MTLDEAKGLLLQAASCRIGLVLRTNDPKRARARLYSAKYALGDLAEGLQIRGWYEAEGDLIVHHRQVSGAEPPKEPLRRLSPAATKPLTLNDLLDNEDE